MPWPYWGKNAQVSPSAISYKRDPYRNYGDIPNSTWIPAAMYRDAGARKSVRPVKALPGCRLASWDSPPCGPTIRLVRRAGIEPAVSGLADVMRPPSNAALTSAPSLVSGPLPFLRGSGHARTLPRLPSTISISRPSNVVVSAHVDALGTTSSGWSGWSPNLIAEGRRWRSSWSATIFMQTKIMKSWRTLWRSIHHIGIAWVRRG